MAKINYYIDFEFLEGTQKNLFGFTTKPTIEMISIGVASDDDRQFYAISKDFNLKEAWTRADVENKNGTTVKTYWLRENVLQPIFRELVLQLFADETYDGSRTIGFDYESMKFLIQRYGMSRKQIRWDLTKFLLDPNDELLNDWLGDMDSYFKTITENNFTDVRLYGYYSAFDHVCLSWIYGKMINLPEGIPMYTRDLKQTMDEIVEELYESDRLLALGQKVDNFKSRKGYPEAVNCHNALSDALWNKQLHDFLMTTKHRFL